MHRLLGGLRPPLARELHHLQPERNTIPGDVDLAA
jgi:hypothetical protein